MSFADPHLLAALLNLLPDIPRWVETRGMLLAQRCKIFGDSTNTVVVDTVMPVMAILGKPAAGLLNEAISSAVQPVHILAAPENDVLELLPGWIRETATLHLLQSSPDLRYDDVKWIDTDESLPEPLALELERAKPWSPIAAKFVDGKPVAFCYASSETETLWDVSIDTVEGYRRKGYAMECVAFMIAFMRKKGKQPVWGALNSNPASLQLAKKLGFKPVDQITVFDR